MGGDEATQQVRRRFNWRRWNNILHRDAGYLVAALTIAYGISGIAVNHVQDWNPNYRITKEILTIDPISSTARDAMIAEALRKISDADSLMSSFRPDAETLQLFFDKKMYTIDVPTGNVLMEVTRPRRVLYEMNQLHLNAPKRYWTYIADLFSLALIVVAITGLFVLKGKNGITGRGAWLTFIGLAVPVLYWVYHVYGG